MLTYYLFRIGQVLTRFLPVWLGYVISDLAGNIGYFASADARRNVQDNLSHVLGTGSRRRLAPVARAVFKNTARNYYDLLSLAYLSPEEATRRANVVGLDNLDRALERGKGVIFLSAHLGNFNLVAAHALRRYRTTIIVENIQPPKLFEFVSRLREALGVRMLPLSGLTLRSVYRALSNNEVVGMMGDRDILGNGVPVPFFGDLARMPAGPVAIALRTGAAIVPAYTIRLSGSKSAGYVQLPIVLEASGDFERDVLEGTRRVASVLEGYIRKAPDQWTVLQGIWDLESRTSAGGDVRHLPPLAALRSRRASKPPSDLG